MKKKFTLAFCVCIVSAALAQYNSKNLSIRENLVTQFTYKNLRLYPIYANQTFLDVHKNIGKYTTLQKALEQKKVLITEAVDTTRRVVRVQNQINAPNQNVQQRGISSGGGETVNKLFIENISNDTVMVLAGEVMKGGKQDRVIAQDIILPPKSGKMDISVFCVEQGRWNYGEAGARGGRFEIYSNVSSSNVRKAAIVEKNQKQVWDKVADITTKNSAGTSTGTYTALDTSKKLNNELKGYTNYFKAVMKTQRNVIGVVACTGDKVIGCDMFATPGMFSEYFDNLLNSYSTEALTNGLTAKTDYKKVQEYLDKILSDESKQEEVVKKNGTMLKNKGKKLHLATF